MPDLSQLLSFGVEQRASDLHLKPGSPPVLRRHGNLESTSFPVLSAEDTEGFLAGVIPPDRAAELAATGQVRFAHSSPAGRYRIHAFRQRGALALSIRVVPGIAAGFETLGLPPVARRLGEETRGLILVTGQPGSGRSTTVSAIVDSVNESQARHIVTIEDPIEQIHDAKRSLVSQREIGADALDTVSALHGALAQDADVVVVGEIGRAEVAEAVLHLAAQGRLVIGVVAATDTAATVDFLVNLFPADRQARIRAALAGCLRGILSQRLLERVDGKGRIPAVEVLLGTGRVADAIVSDEGAAGLEQIMTEGEYHGMQTFDQSLFNLYKNGLIGLGDALAAASHAHDLRITLQQAGLDSV